MKNLFLTATMLVVALSTHAQKIFKGEMPSLKGEKKINLVIDYSKITIDDKTVSDWLEYRQAMQPDYNAKDELEKELKPALTEAFVTNVNKKLEKCGAYLADSKDANYTLILIPYNVKKKGDNMNTCVITDKTGKEIVSIDVKGSGGTFGSMSNLWGDGYSNTGGKLGSFLAKYFKK